MTIPKRYNVIYPGHPLVIATLILDKYRDTLGEAFERTEHGWPKALGDSDIPGAGDAVYSGLSVLHYIRDGHHTPTQAVEEAIKFWIYLRDQSSAYRDKIAPGNEQALACVPEFLELVEKYIHLVPAKQ